MAACSKAALLRRGRAQDSRGAPGGAQEAEHACVEAAGQRGPVAAEKGQPRGAATAPAPRSRLRFCTAGGARARQCAPAACRSCRASKMKTRRWTITQCVKLCVVVVACCVFTPYSARVPCLTNVCDPSRGGGAHQVGRRAGLAGQKSMASLLRRAQSICHGAGASAPASGAATPRHASTPRSHHSSARSRATPRGRSTPRTATPPHRDASRAQTPCALPPPRAALSGAASPSASRRRGASQVSSGAASGACTPQGASKRVSGPGSVEAWELPNANDLTTGAPMSARGTSHAQTLAAADAARSLMRRTPGS